MIGSSHHGFTYGKSLLTSLVGFFDKLTRFEDGRIAMHVIYFDFSKAFNTVSLSILLSTLGHYGLDGKRAQWVESWLYDQAQRVVIKGHIIPEGQ